MLLAQNIVIIKSLFNNLDNIFSISLGVSVTLKHPYERNIPEPTQYEHVTRHAELGKNTSFDSDMSKASPDLHVSMIFIEPFYTEIDRTLSLIRRRTVALWTIVRFKY